MHFFLMGKSNILNHGIYINLTLSKMHSCNTFEEEEERENIYIGMCQYGYL